jgi:hypothetical protein
MPSIFKTKSSTRTRTLSSPGQPVDELGRVVSHENGRATPTPSKSKSSKKKKKQDEYEAPMIPDGTFVGFNLGSGASPRDFVVRATLAYHQHSIAQRPVWRPIKA